MISNLLPFLMFGILLAALLARPLQRLPWISLPVALVIAGFVASEAWVAAGLDTGLRWQILSDLVFYLLLPILIFEAAITIDTRWLVRDGVLIGALSVPLLVVAIGVAALSTGHWVLGDVLDERVHRSFVGKFADAGAGLKDNFWAIFTDA